MARTAGTAYTHTLAITFFFCRTHSGNQFHGQESSSGFLSGYVLLLLLSTLFFLLPLLLLFQFAYCFFLLFLHLITLTVFTGPSVRTMCLRVCMAILYASWNFTTAKITKFAQKCSRFFLFVPCNLPKRVPRCCRQMLGHRLHSSVMIHNTIFVLSFSKQNKKKMNRFSLLSVSHIDVYFLHVFNFWPG